jgi:RNA polymerase-binding transcription factor DksA
MDGFLLETVEALEASPLAGNAGGIWESLQAEKEEVSRDLLGSGPLRHDTIAFDEIEPSEECAQEIEWRHRGNLEDRLRAINDAQDRLIDGGYGLCLDCGHQINQKRLLANPAASLCLVCQQVAEGELCCRSL